jgi:hypothetical protein
MLAGWVKREVSWTLQSREEIATENAVFFRFLAEQVGGEIANAWIKIYLDEVEKEIETCGKPGEQIAQQVSMLQIEGGLTFWPYLNTSKTFNPKDPINFIFWRYGATSIVSDLLVNRVGGWASTLGVTLYGFIDDSAHGGRMDWKKFDVQLRKGSFWTTSHHVRIYEGFCPCTHGKLVYSLAGVHEEQFLTWPPSWGSIRGHTPISWDNARNLLETDVQSVPNTVASTVKVNLNTITPLQGIPHDSHASYIELMRPSWLTAA